MIAPVDSADFFPLAFEERLDSADWNVIKGLELGGTPYFSSSSLQMISPGSLGHEASIWVTLGK